MTNRLDPLELLQVAFEREESLRRETSLFLHDEVAQLLAILKIQIQQLPDRERSPFEETQKLLERTIGEVRQRALDLRPSLLDDLGLVPAVKWFLRTESKAADVRLILDDVSMPIPLDAALACFRVIQLVVRQVGGPIELQLSNSEGAFILSLGGPETSIIAFPMTILEIRLRIEHSGGKLVIEEDSQRGWSIQARYLPNDR